MTYQRILGIIFIIGSLAFLFAAFHPVSRIFGEPDSSKRLEILMKERTGWSVSQLFFILGSVIVALAMGLQTFHFRTTPGFNLALTGTIAVLAGAIFWSIHCYLRHLDPAGFINGSLPGWHFLAYTYLTMGGMVLFGFLVLNSGIRNWVGLTLVIGNVVFLILFLIFKDMPPFVYYVLTLIAGIVLVL